MSDHPYGPIDRRSEAGTPSPESTERSDDVGDRVRARGSGDDDRPHGGDDSTDRVPSGARETREPTERDVQARWGQALTLDDPGGRNHALADLARRDDVDPDMGRRVGNSIVGDDHLRTDALTELADRTDDPRMAHRIATDIPSGPERRAALARLTHRFADDAGNIGRTDHEGFTRE